MEDFKWFLHQNHKRALDSPEFDIDGSNDGWTLFWNSEEKRNSMDCEACMSTLIKKVKESTKPGKIDLSMLKDCYKVVFTASVDNPINYLIKGILKEYVERYSDSTEVHGKLGGYGKGGTRVLFFYENSSGESAERKKQLIDLVEDLDLIGKITESRACDYMLDHINLDKTQKSKVRRPEIFLQRLKNNKVSYDKRELK